MPQLNPGEQYPIVRVLKDHTDSATNYVRAVIRDARKVDNDFSNSVIETINLTDHGSRIFSGVWDVPYSSIDRHYVITTTVYTDAAYTTKNANYAEESESYIVATRWGLQFGYGGGGSNVDYKKIRDIVTEELKGIPEPERFNIGSLVAAMIPAMRREIGAIHIPEMPAIDLKPVHEHLARIATAVGNIPTAPDTKPIVELMRTEQEKIISYLSSFELDMPKIEEAVIRRITEAVVSNAKRELTKDIFKIEVGMSEKGPAAETAPTPSARQNFMNRYAHQ